MDWIFDRLALGCQEDGIAATAPSITTCLHVGQQVYTPHHGVSLLHVPIEDEVCLPQGTWSPLVYVLGTFLRHGERVLVHCRLGKSRSPALVCAYLMQCGMGPEEARAYVHLLHPVMAIHPETWRGVMEWWERMQAGSNRSVFIATK